MVHSISSRRIGHLSSTWTESIHLLLSCQSTPPSALIWPLDCLSNLAAPICTPRIFRPEDPLFDRSYFSWIWLACHPTYRIFSHSPLLLRWFFRPWSNLCEIEIFTRSIQTFFCQHLVSFSWRNRKRYHFLKKRSLWVSIQENWWLNCSKEIHFSLKSM